MTTTHVLFITYKAFKGVPDCIDIEVDVSEGPRRKTRTWLVCLMQTPMMPGKHPASYCSRRGLLPLVVWLCEKKGAMITVLNKQDMCPVDLANANGHDDVVQYLIGRSKLIGTKRN